MHFTFSLPVFEKADVVKIVINIVALSTFISTNQNGSKNIKENSD